MESVSTNGWLSGRTALIAPSVTREVAFELKRFGARVIGWPQVEIGAPENYTALDEAIETLFGYDWIIFRNICSVEYFVRRFHDLDHETSELDAVRVFAVGSTTAEELTALNIHVDLFASQQAWEKVLIEFENYLGGRDFIAATNFLLPRAANSCETLSQILKEFGARVDAVTAYRTAKGSALVQLKTLLFGGGVDCLIFAKAEDLQNFAKLLDAGDLSRLFDGATIACLNEATAKEAARFGLKGHVLPQQATIPALTEAIAKHFPNAGGNV